MLVYWIKLSFFSALHMRSIRINAFNELGRRIKQPVCRGFSKKYWHVLTLLTERKESRDSLDCRRENHTFGQNRSHLYSTVLRGWMIGGFSLILPYCLPCWLRGSTAKTVRTTRPTSNLDLLTHSHMWSSCYWSVEYRTVYVDKSW